MIEFTEKIGKGILDFFHKLGENTILVWKTIRSAFQKGFPIKETIHHMAKIGYESLPVIIITAFFTGMVLAFQTGSYMETKIKGIARYMGGGIAITMVRELGPVLTSLLVAGRSGSAIAAEIGSMRVTEQIDALVTLATNPIQYLILPRVLAGVIAFPLLVIFADIFGILGGSLIAKVVIDQPLTLYFSTITKLIDFSQVLHGLIKSAVFGFFVIFLSCARGYEVQGGAESVGRATTQAVVSGSMAIFVVDYIMTALLR
jgi:phospholipid/cholesterol/gamma-HCH transport system permease protein